MIRYTPSGEMEVLHEQNYVHVPRAGAKIILRLAEELKIAIELLDRAGCALAF